MGPRSDNRGYALAACRFSIFAALQWVHGRITVVMLVKASSTDTMQVLQWVHGRRTVVMACKIGARNRAVRKLQWVHGRITVVMEA